MVCRLKFVVSALACSGLSIKPALARQSVYEKGEALLREVAARYQSLHTLSGELTEEWSYVGQEKTRRAQVALGKPNLARFEYEDTGELVVRDGKRVWRLDRQQSRYSKRIADPVYEGAIVSDENPIAFFFSTGRLTFKPVAEYIGTERVDGEDCQMVDASLSQGRERLYVGPDLLIRRITGKHNGRNFAYAFRRVTINPPIRPEEFTFQPPPGAQLMENPAAGNMLPAGTRAPDFQVKTFQGDRLQLHDLLKKRKAVVVHFWLYG